MAESQNGYPVLDDDTEGPLPRLRSWVIPGAARRLLLRDGSAGFLLIHFALWYDDTIEKITPDADDWGYSVRRISGSSDYSNHASGTAIDLNANKHPLGVAPERSFTSAQIRKIRRRIGYYQGCLRWGGDYQSRPDAMHFELNRELVWVQKLARELTGTPRGALVCKANSGVKALIHS